jgi:2',3'-cyclic-nucleotide 2'-phosphodiesterase/3'-nucleotidase
LVVTRFFQEIRTIAFRRPREAKLRLLATSDLHMQITSFDYIWDRQSNGSSLAKLAVLIREARQEADQSGATCLLFDNGDTFQGSAVADVIAASDDQRTHPMVASMNYLGYDAGGLGNHDFDYGLDRLQACLEQYEMPVVCSNLTSKQLGALRPYCTLERKVSIRGGGADTLKIGVVSSLPDKTALWSQYHLQERASVKAPLPCLDKTASLLRDKGADIVIALAHMGLALFDEGPEAQNLIHDVAGLENIDVVIGGHTHLRFPGPDHKGLKDADWVTGTVLGKPVAQPGASAKDLAVIDLRLQKSAAGMGWKIASHSVDLRSARADTPEDTRILSFARKTHEKTRKLLSAPVGRIAKPMHSYFALADPSPIPALLAASKYRVVARAIADTDHATLPLLAQASVALTGGLEGPDNFIFLPAGEIRRRHIAGMNPYANNVWAVRTTGAQLIEWLERSALIFNTLQADDPDQLLTDPNVPGFRYDAIYGLEYRIDPSRPPLFDATGGATGATSGRVRDVSYRGSAIEPAQEFIVATTDHRAGGGGLYRPFPSGATVLKGYAPLQDAVLDYLRAPDCDEVRTAKPWSFARDLNLSAVLHTAPQAANHLEEIAHLAPEICGQSDDGFLRIRIHL